MKRLLLAIALLGLPLFSLAQAPVPSLISYQGRVTDAAGALIGASSPVNRTVIFRIWNSPTLSASANRLYSEQQVVTIANGEFSVLIGSGTAVSGETNPGTLADAFNATTGVFAATTARFLGITIDDPAVATDPEISPRQQFVSTPYAARAKIAEGLSGQITAAQITNATITATQIATGTITADRLASSFYSSYPDFTGGLRADAGLNVNHGGTSGTTMSMKANGGDTILLEMFDNTTSRFRMDKNGNLTIGGTLAAASISGSISGSQIADNSISQAKLNFSPGVTDNSVTTAKIVDGNVTSAKLASNLTFSGYPQFPTGARVDAGLNVNHPGTGGVTSTMKAGVSDTTILDLHDSSDVSKFSVTKTGAVGTAGALSVGGAATVSGAATLSGGATINNALTVTGGGSWANYPTFPNGARADVGLNVNHPGAVGATMTIQSNSSDTYIVNMTNQAGASIFNVLRTGNAQLYGVLSNSSDRRLKHNIHPLVGSLDRLLRLRPVTFEYNDPVKFKAGVHAGFIAQDMEEVFPEWVFTEEDGMKSIGFRGFESTTVQALRELRAEKDAQLQQRDATIAALEKNVAAMKSEAAETKSQLAALQKAVADLSARASN